MAYVKCGYHMESHATQFTEARDVRACLSHCSSDTVPF